MQKFGRYALALAIASLVLSAAVIWAVALDGAFGQLWVYICGGLAGLLMLGSLTYVVAVALELR